MDDSFIDYTTAGPIGHITQDNLHYYEFQDPTTQDHYFVEANLYRWFLNDVANRSGREMPGATVAANVQGCVFPLYRKAEARYMMTQKNGRLMFTGVNAAQIDHLVGNVPHNHP